MNIRDVTFTSPQENILYEDVMLHMAAKERKGSYLRFWESPEVFIVLGRVGRAYEDVNWEFVRADGIPVVRRSSGGGTVLQGPGCLNYSLVLDLDEYPQCRDLGVSYKFILDKIVHILKKDGINAQFFPISDIALADSQKKFSGNAQRRTKNAILHHGTVLYDFDLSLISRYLSMPKSIPEYRQSRSHDAFVSNISIQLASFKASFMSEYVTICDNSEPDVPELSMLKDMVAQSNICVTD